MPYDSTDRRDPAISGIEPDDDNDNAGQMDMETAFAHIETFIAGGDELGEVPEEDATKALEIIRAKYNELRDARRSLEGDLVIALAHNRTLTAALTLLS